VQNLDVAPVVRWSKERNLRLLSRLFAEGALRTEGLISHTILPADLPSIYDTLAENPQDYLGVLVDWKRDDAP
jgi:hypothetical protein